MTFTAVIDEDDNTKTLLEGALGDGFRNVLWQPGDAIGISSDIEHMMLGSVEKFVANTEIAALSTEFDGFISMSSKYKAFYPYSETLKDSSSYFIFTLPTEQKYVKNTFDPAAAPMVAVADYGETLKFRNLCGVLALQLTGDEIVKSIVFSGLDEAGNLVKVSGGFEVDPHQDELSIRPLGKSYSSVKMSCETPVALDPAKPTAFHIVLPAGTYSRFTVMIVTEEGVMYKEATKPLTIRRSEVQPTAALMYVESEYIDLSAIGTANSYIVDKGAGLYSFDATVIGNGVYGFIDGVEFHTDSPYIKPAKAKLLWEDRTGIINNVDFDGERVIVATTGKEGNALIAVTDNNEDILWSWHIWVTDQPQEQVYVNSTGNYPMMDRNLGAIRADRGVDNDWYDTKGLLYQWGRKDPFGYIFDYSYPGKVDLYSLYNENYGSTSLAQAIKTPTTLYGKNYSNWCSGQVDSLWNRYQKTIYDPCPVGYTVPPTDAWRSFSSDETYRHSTTDGWNVIDFTSRGLDFIYDGVNTSYYPTGHGISDRYWSETQGFLWSSEEETNHHNDNARGLWFWYEYIYNNDCYLAFDYHRQRRDAHAVRCMKDAGYEATCVPMVKITVKDKFTDGARVEGKISSQGLSAVTECGFVWGTSSDITLENASSQKLVAGNFTYTITGLENATKYYVRAYAKNENGVGYSQPQFFYTVWEGEAIDLSKDGTANCYIVTPYYAEYSFNATVRGNSTEPVGNIYEAVVLWETEMKADDAVSSNHVKVGDIISSESLKIDEHGYVHFMLPYEPKEGNALIAVKDANGTILWSWHIWVVDFDPNDTQKKYNTGLVMMDRNLGATSVVPSSFPDYTAFGLYYQWGRKDPLVNCVCAPWSPFELYGNEAIDQYNNIEYTYSHPTVFRDDWDGGQDLWKDLMKDEKTINDPCPAGWRVPSAAVWNNWSYVGDCPTGDYMRISSPYSDTATYYPFAGVGDWTSISDVRNNGHYWSATKDYTFKLWNYGCYMLYELNSGNKASVRCMKDEKAPVTGGGKDYIIDDEYEW